MGDFLRFRKMITPILIQIIFWVGVIVSIITAIGLMIYGGSEKNGEGLILLGFVWLFLGPLSVRIYCEILILVFRISETLTEIKHNTERNLE